MLKTIFFCGKTILICANGNMESVRIYQDCFLFVFQVQKEAKHVVVQTGWINQGINTYMYK